MSVISRGIRKYGLENVMNVYLVSKGARPAFLYDGNKDSPEFGHWLEKNAQKFGIDTFTDSRGGLFVISAEDSEKKNEMLVKVETSRGIGEVLGFMRPVNKFNDRFKYCIDVYVNRKSDGKKEFLYYELSDRNFTDQYVHRVLDQLDSVFPRGQYFFTAEIEDNSTGYECKCAYCVI